MTDTNYFITTSNTEQDITSSKDQPDLAVDASSANENTVIEKLYTTTIDHFTTRIPDEISEEQLKVTDTDTIKEDTTALQQVINVENTPSMSIEAYTTERIITEKYTEESAQENEVFIKQENEEGLIVGDGDQIVTTAIEGLAVVDAASNNNVLIEITTESQENIQTTEDLHQSEDDIKNIQIDDVEKITEQTEYESSSTETLQIEQSTTETTQERTESDLFISQEQNEQTFHKDDEETIIETTEISVGTISDSDITKAYEVKDVDEVEEYHISLETTTQNQENSPETSTIVIEDVNNFEDKTTEWNQKTTTEQIVTEQEKLNVEEISATEKSELTTQQQSSALTNETKLGEETLASTEHISVTNVESLQISEKSTEAIFQGSTASTDGIETDTEDSEDFIQVNNETILEDDEAITHINDKPESDEIKFNQLESIDETTITANIETELNNNVEELNDIEQYIATDSTHNNNILEGTESTEYRSSTIHETESITEENEVQQTANLITSAEQHIDQEVNQISTEEIRTRSDMQTPTEQYTDEIQDNTFNDLNNDDEQTTEYTTTRTVTQVIESEPQISKGDLNQNDLNQINIENEYILNDNRIEEPTTQLNNAFDIHTYSTTVSDQSFETSEISIHESKESSFEVVETSIESNTRPIEPSYMTESYSKTQADEDYISTTQVYKNAHRGTTSSDLNSVTSDEGSTTSESNPYTSEMASTTSELNPVTSEMRSTTSGSNPDTSEKVSTTLELNEATTDSFKGDAMTDIHYKTPSPPGKTKPEKQEYIPKNVGGKLALNHGKRGNFFYY